MNLCSPFLDEELDPVSSREVSLHLASCSACAAAYERHRMLHGSLQRELEYHLAPDRLRARMVSELRAGTEREGARSRLPAPSWRELIAVVAMMALVGVTWTTLARWPRVHGDDPAVREAVSGHIRSLMANHLTDVTSTDQHTVKPWFNGKLDFSPPVADFAAADYPLVGGRLDYLQGHPVAALVYMHRRHAINVFVWPAARAHETTMPVATMQGYHVIHGTRSGMTFWVVSDLAAQELAGFAAMFAALPRGSDPPPH